jgi:5-methylcytosine-specific restriction endonuclease McrA
MHKMTFEEAVTIRNKYYGEPIQDIKPIKKPIGRPKKITITGREIDELAEKRKKKREKNRARNEYDRQFKVNRLIALALDNNTCRECGSKEDLHVHHIMEKSKGGTNDINNLITLCNNCHKEKHKHEPVYNIMNA